jgi:hypothetical protein
VKARIRGAGPGLSSGVGVCLGVGVGLEVDGGLRVDVGLHVGVSGAVTEGVAGGRVDAGMTSRAQVARARSRHATASRAVPRLTALVPNPGYAAR